MSLNLTQLDAILALPCVLAAMSFKELPIMAEATRFGTSEFLHNVMTGEDLPKFLARIHNGAKTYPMDCSIFAQLAGMALGNKWPKNGGYIFLYIGDEAGHVLLCSRKIPQMGYISVSDPQVAERFQKSPIIDKGQWAIQVGDNAFLGLGKGGPQVLTMEQWVTRLRDNLQMFGSSIHDRTKRMLRSPEELILASTAVIIECYFKLDRMNKWGFYTAPGQLAIAATWTPDGVVVQAQEVPHSQPKSDDLSKHFPPGSVDASRFMKMVDDKVTIRTEKKSPLGLEASSNVESVTRTLSDKEDYISNLFRSAYFTALYYHQQAIKIKANSLMGSVARPVSITVHKSQGNEWPHPVEVVHPEEPVTSSALQERHRVESGQLRGVEAARSLLRQSDRDVWPHQRFSYDELKRTTTLRETMEETVGTPPAKPEVLSYRRFKPELLALPPRGDGRNGFGWLPPRVSSPAKLTPAHKEALRRLLNSDDFAKVLHIAHLGGVVMIPMEEDDRSQIQFITDDEIRRGDRTIFDTAQRGVIGSSREARGPGCSSRPMMGEMMDGLIGMYSDFDGDELIPADRTGQHGLIIPSASHQNPLLSFRSAPSQRKSSRVQARELKRRQQKQHIKSHGSRFKIKYHRMNSGQF